jgi:hypothetical protein
VSNNFNNNHKTKTTLPPATTTTTTLSTTTTTTFYILKFKTFEFFTKKYSCIFMLGNYIKAISIQIFIGTYLRFVRTSLVRNN